MRLLPLDSVRLTDSLNMSLSVTYSVVDTVPSLTDNLLLRLSNGKALVTDVQRGCLAAISSH